MSDTPLTAIIESALMVAGEPLSVQRIQALFVEEAQPEKAAIEQAIAELQQAYAERAFELVQTASGYRIQVRQTFAPYIVKLWEEKPPRYSRAVLETLALIAYRQPITRGQIEEVRGVAVSSHIIKTLTDRDWIKVVGHKEVPGRPALFATTKQFLDDFGLQSLNDLPTLQELIDLDQADQQLQVELALNSEEEAVVEVSEAVEVKEVEEVEETVEAEV
jgi:segregation and condensation protein B